MAARKRKAEAAPGQEIQRLSRELSSGSLPSAVVLRGEERYFVDEAVALLTKAGAKADLELCRYDTADPDFQIKDLMGDLLGGALFASARLFLVKGADALLKKTAGTAAKGFPDAVLARVAAGDGSMVVLVGAGLRGNQTLIKKLGEAGAWNIACRKLWDSPPPWDPDPRKAELVQWLVARARQRKIPMGADQAAYVVAATGNDLFALDRQLDRVQQGEQDGQGNVRDQVIWEGNASPFTLAEPMLAGDVARATAGIETLFQSGFQGRDGARTLDRGALIALLISALSSKLRELVAGAEVLSAGGSMADARSQAGVKASPVAAKAFEARLGLRPPAEWKACYRDLQELERTSRTGAAIDANDFVALALSWRRKSRR
ncbi:MAG: hypothetical protein P1V35_07030 [Planctomycetota bacterium]|nr:hypothetical protein [Planctomycetota bacterium]